jgi:hypothetical protein
VHWNSLTENKYPWAKYVRPIFYEKQDRVIALWSTLSHRRTIPLGTYLHMEFAPIKQISLSYIHSPYFQWETRKSICSVSTLSQRRTIPLTINICAVMW